MSGGIIVLEGPDGAGKSTLGRYFQEKYGAVYMHATHRFANNMDLYHTAYLRRCIRLVQQGNLVVLDRWWPSETVYAGVYRDPLRFNSIARVLDRVVQRYCGVYVLCQPLKQTMLDTIQSRKDDPRPEFNKNAEEVYDWYALGSKPQSPYYDMTYWSIFKRKSVLRHDVFLYDYEQHGDNSGLATFCPRVVRQATRTYIGSKVGLSNQSFAGNWWADQAIVVHEPATKSLYPRKFKNFDFPLYDVSQPAYNWMNRMLNDGRVCESNLFWFNSAKPNSDKNKMKFATNIANKRRIIALGRDASDFLLSYGIEHLSAPGVEEAYQSPESSVENRFKTYLKELQ